MDIFEALLAADTAIQQKNDLRILNAAIATIECGDCSKWMIERQCPREARGVRVTCRDAICSEFAESSLSVQQRRKWQIEAAEITSELKKAN